MKKLLVFILTAVVLTSTAHADLEDITVYVTEFGTKYHREDCSYLENADCRAMTLDVAVRKGYTACSRCRPNPSDDESKEPRGENGYSKVETVALWTIIIVCVFVFLSSFIEERKVHK